MEIIPICQSQHFKIRVREPSQEPKSILQRRLLLGSCTIKIPNRTTTHPSVTASASSSTSIMTPPTTSMDNGRQGNKRKKIGGRQKKDKIALPPNNTSKKSTSLGKSENTATSSQKKKRKKTVVRSKYAATGSQLNRKINTEVILFYVDKIYQPYIAKYLITFYLFEGCKNKWYACLMSTNCISTPFTVCSFLPRPLVCIMYLNI